MQQTCPAEANHWIKCSEKADQSRSSQRGRHQRSSEQCSVQHSSSEEPLERPAECASRRVHSLERQRVRLHKSRQGLRLESLVTGCARERPHAEGDNHLEERRNNPNAHIAGCHSGVWRGEHYSLSQPRWTERVLV